ncbi:MAG: copper homeostasis protein CutC [Phycisphaerales bacterium]|nr:copper homeostasis protein CutC [Phycisphaerales bacterium]
MPMPLLEIAVDSLADALAAIRAGADRLELCSALDRQGLSPDPALIRAVRAASFIPIMAMVRPRAGGFVHDEDGWKEHLGHAETMLEAGAAGVVFGALTPGRVQDADLPRCRELARPAAGRDIVFHRAFDLIDPTRWPAALDGLAEAGITRILSAGLTPASTAHALGLMGEQGGPAPAPEPLEERLARLRALNTAASSRGLEVIGCGGLRAANVLRFVGVARLSQLHSTARTGSPPVFDPREAGDLRGTIDLRCAGRPSSMET